MGGIAGSRFFGYRELARPPRRQSGLPPPYRMGFTGMPMWEVDMMSNIPYLYRNFRGVAEDDYPADFNMFPFPTRVVMCLLKDHGAVIAATNDGVTPLEEREYEAGFIRLENLEGFKIKNKIPGYKARYQIIGFR